MEPHSEREGREPPDGIGAPAPSSDVIILHAHEDEGPIAGALAKRLRERGYSVGESELGAGGLSAGEPSAGRARLVILSPGFLAAGWSHAELQALVNREMAGAGPPTIPIWHRVDAQQVRDLSPALADRRALSTDVGLEAVIRGVESVLRESEGGRQPVPAAGTDAPEREEGRRIPLISWLRKDKDISVGDYIAIAVLAAAILAGIFALAKAVQSSSPGTGSGSGSGTVSQSGTGGSSRRHAASAPPSGTIVEYADNHAGSPVFADPQGTAVKGVPARIPYGTRVPVACFVANASGEMGSVSGFYLIADGAWRGNYVVADTMTNGGAVGTTTTPNVDPAVPHCDSTR